MKINQILTSIAVAGTIALFGCETAPKPASQPAQKIICTVPNIAALPETQESQDKGGIEIAVVPVLYKAVRKDAVSVEQAQPSVDAGTILFGHSSHAGQVYVKETVTPSLNCEPDRLQFTVRINNKLSRVFRGQGSVVQFNVGGKLIDFGQTDYKEFMNGIVPPRNETTLNIYGPALNALGEKGTIGIFLYDVVTDTDKAGNVTEKQNYTWYFNYSTKTVEELVETKTTERWMSASEYQNILLQRQREQIMRGIPTALQAHP